jgi:hypothetical protein
MRTWMLATLPALLLCRTVQADDIPPSNSPTLDQPYAACTAPKGSDRWSYCIGYMCGITAVSFPSRCHFLPSGRP